LKRSALQKFMKIELVRVHYVPRNLEPGKLYVSEEFGAAVHLCACGCGSKVSTPLGATEWALEETEKGPKLTPSVGNWQLPCKSHYWIKNGTIVWSGEWTASQIAAGRRAEENRRRDYFDNLDRTRGGIRHRLWYWITHLFR
jgi:hypothetical protein